MEVLQEDEEYNWREVRLPSMTRVEPEPELEREKGERRRGRDILIAIDHGPNSKHAFDWALIHLCRMADTIHLVHAVSSMLWISYLYVLHNRVLEFGLISFMGFFRCAKYCCLRDKPAALGEACCGGFAGCHG